MNQLEQLNQYTEIVLDSGEIEKVKELKPQDSTTNPSLIIKALKNKKYHYCLTDAVKSAKQLGKTKKDILRLAAERTAVNFGSEILKSIPGKISTEVDSRLSFNSEATILQANRIIQHYEEKFISRDRVLIKIASTWEGIQAAKILQQQNINCNLTLLFSLPQAIAAAQAQAYLISPFVGRILDWYKNNFPDGNYTKKNDPGVKLVTEIYNYYQSQNVKTIIMGASFRNIEQIKQLAGCDKLTISPALIEKLKNQTATITKKLDPKKIVNPENSKDFKKVADFTEKDFRWQLNENSMATEKLAEGIRLFSSDLIQLELLILNELS